MSAVMKMNMANIRADFPILQQQNGSKPLVYLDNAASTQKPHQVLDALTQFYAHDYANIHRGIYELSARATRLYEAARVAVQQFIHAQSANEIVFVRGTTEAINLVAQSYGHMAFKQDDEIIVGGAEHHSNIVPWYLLAKQLGLTIKVIPVLEDGSLDIQAYHSLFSDKTRLVAVSHASNVLGVINPVEQMTDIAHAHNVPILIDGAQAVPHMPVDVQEIDCDFYAFSGHKVYGPTGIGVLYAKQHWLERMPPYQGGGGMIETVCFNHITFAKSPQKFEAGTPDIAGAIGLHAAINYLQQIDMTNVFAHEQALLHYAEPLLQQIKGLRIIGTKHPKVGVISFVLDHIHPHDIGTVLDHEGVAVRAGHHCSMPLMERFNVSATLRASFGVYNNNEDIDALCRGLEVAVRLFA